MGKKTNKSSKLRNFTCVVCGKKFQRRLSLSSIKNGRGKVCSQKCKTELCIRTLRKGRYIKCVRCGKMFWVRPSEEKKNRRFCSYKCFFPAGKGKSISSDGYYVYSTKKVHRLVMEKHIGRKLLPTEIVHHINFDKLDNRIENLQIVSRSEHNKIHQFLKKRLDKRNRHIIDFLESKKWHYGCQSEASRKFGLSESLISFIVKNFLKTV